MPTFRTKSLKLDPNYQEHIRAKIATSGVVVRLIGHVMDAKRHPMSSSQVTAGVALMKKIVPDLQATELIGTLTSYVARLPEPAISVQAWQDSLVDGHSEPVGSPLMAIEDPNRPCAAKQ